MPIVSTQITQGIRVNVIARFIEQESLAQTVKYIFAYQIEIKNESESVVQLLTREWHIVNGFGVRSMVKGEGVVGRKPVIAPGESYKYMSGTQFQTPIGKMYGSYQMRRLSDNEVISVIIPEFVMEALGVSN